ncbi:type II secretion system protein M [Sphingomonas sp. SUN039]|uniref:type II secretion system protein M n=1 Tax=Sphingomonas sp. SUN039 TaxID=2937787 RepID=UPI00216441A9|nr:type II secretion system protein M [Sphingomonas sp. SUN039]UVO53912.1 type II secretion system protein M [Sphingomonas sp. SUN039]
MIAQALLWWSGRSERERMLLAVMGTLIALLLFWLIVIRPIDNARAQAEARLEAATLAAGRVAAVADRVRLSRLTPAPALSSPLPLAVGTTAEAAGFTLSRLDPVAPDRVNIGISTARGPALFGWLAQLARQGVIVERITLRTNSDATLAVEGTLRVRAR